MRGGALGDFVLTLPVIRVLAENYPSAQIDLVAQGEYFAMAQRTLLLGEMRRLDDPRLGPFFARDAELPEDWRAFFSGAELIVSYLHDPAEIFRANIARDSSARFVPGPSRIQPGSHATDQLAAPLRELGIPVHDLTFSFPERPQTGAVALHPGSGGKRKNWPIARWLEFTEYLLARDLEISIIGGEADTDEIDAFRTRFPNLDYHVAQPLAELLSLLSGKIFLGHDSGIAHLAAATGARCLLLFGPTDPAVWAPRGRNVKVLRAKKGQLDELPVTETIAAYELMRIGIKT